jgi:serine/threonine protein kinase
MENREEVIHELVDRWDAAREAGRRLSAEELCRDHPELIEAVRGYVTALKWLPSPPPADPPFSATGALEVPRTLGRYELQELLGAGGFGEVWKAWDPQLQRHVAIKIPRLDWPTSPQSTDRFVEEARKVAQLKHPGIVPVFDAGREGRWGYIVSELIEGESLAKRIAQGQLPWPEAVRIVVAVAESLHYAHEQGFVHRDVKPANILLDGSGGVFLTDFGVAATEAQLRQESRTSGTLAYMSPEQVRGDVPGLDRRTDLFSLGVVLYELLVGRRPFVGKHPHELREQILEADPTPPRQVNSSIPVALEQVCLRALAKEPEERFQTVAAMADALRAVDQPRLGRRKQVTLGIVMAGMAVLAGVAGGTVVLWTRHAPEAESSRPTSEMRGVGTRVPTSPAGTESDLQTTPGTLVPGSLDWLETWENRQEQEILPRLKEIRQSINQPPSLPPRRPFGLKSPNDPVPVVWFTFDDPQNRLRNRGRLGPSIELKARGKLKFTSPGDPDAPPTQFGSGVRLANGITQEGLIGDKSWLRGPAWSISLWFWQRQSQDYDFLVYLGGLDGCGGGSPEFNATITPLGALEIRIFPETTLAGQRMIVEQLPVEPRKWHHLVITFEAKDTTITGEGTATVYLDNHRIGMRENLYLASAVRFSRSALVFGAVHRKFQPDTWQRALDGVIANIRVFDTALNEEQIARMWREIAP